MLSLRRIERANWAVRLVVFLSISALFAGPLHEMLSRHLLCAAHGVVEESPDAAASKSKSRPAPSHAHEACAAVAQRHNASASHAAVAVTLAQVAPIAAVDPTQGEAHSSVSILRFAPKSSPPA